MSQALCASPVLPSSVLGFKCTSFLCGVTEAFYSLPMWPVFNSCICCFGYCRFEVDPEGKWCGVSKIVLVQNNLCGKPHVPLQGGAGYRWPPRIHRQ